MNIEELSPTNVAVLRCYSSESGCSAALSNVVDPALRLVYNSDVISIVLHVRAKIAYFAGKSSNAWCNRRGMSRAPTLLIVKNGNCRIHVEVPLQQYRRNAQYQYLVKWCGYFDSKISWKLEISLP